MFKTIYFDNASTTFPKPKVVSDAVFAYMTGSGCNINRGCYEGAYETEEVVYETRELLTQLFQGKLELSQAEKLLKPQTKAMILMHASNVCGTIMPLKEAGAFCRKHGIKFIVDSAQTAGLLPIDMEERNTFTLQEKRLSGTHRCGFYPEGTIRFSFGWNNQEEEVVTP